MKALLVEYGKAYHKQITLEERKTKVDNRLAEE